MKKQIKILAASLLFGTACFAQSDSSYSWPARSPKYKIKLETAEGNKITGLLVDKNDSSLVIYPGTANSYKKKKDYKAAIFTNEQIENIKLHKRKAANHGALIGLGVGMLPVVAALFGGKNAQSFVMASVITVPLGTIVGGIIGATSSKSFHIGKQRVTYKKFSDTVKL